MLMKTLRTTALTLLIATTAFADDPPEDAIVGKWYSDGKESKIEITKKDGAYAGRIVWLMEPLYAEDDEEAGKPKHDRNNPDDDKKADPILGLVMLHSFTYDADAKKWTGGKIYDPNNGKTYSCEMTLQGDTLNVRGYIGVPAFGRTTAWTRVTPEDDEKDKDVGATLSE